MMLEKSETPRFFVSKFFILHRLLSKRTVARGSGFLFILECIFHFFLLVVTTDIFNCVMTACRVTL